MQEAIWTKRSTKL